MAKRAQATSSKTSQGESELKERWWKTPAILAAIIAAVATISVAIIQRTAPKSKVADSPTIEQQTHGPGSPAIGKAGRDVTIIQQQGGQHP
jgi:hypothetical protein